MNRSESERVHRSREAEQQLERWRAEVKRLLLEDLVLSRRDGPRAKGVDYVAAAATIVGMFDAGARDSEVVTFLRHLETETSGQASLAEDARRELVTRLHRAAARG